MRLEPRGPGRQHGSLEAGGRSVRNTGPIGQGGRIIALPLAVVACWLLAILSCLSRASPLSSSPGRCSASSSPSRCSSSCRSSLRAAASWSRCRIWGARSGSSSAITRRTDRSAMASRYSRDEADATAAAAALAAAAAAAGLAAAEVASVVGGLMVGGLNRNAMSWSMAWRHRSELLDCRRTERQGSGELWRDFRGLLQTGTHLHPPPRPCRVASSAGMRAHPWLPPSVTPGPARRSCQRWANPLARWRLRQSRAVSPPRCSPLGGSPRPRQRRWRRTRPKGRPGLPS